MFSTGSIKLSVRTVMLGKRMQKPTGFITIFSDIGHVNDIPISWILHFERFHEIGLAIDPA